MRQENTKKTKEGINSESAEQKVTTNHQCSAVDSHRRNSQDRLEPTGIMPVPTEPVPTTWDRTPHPQLEQTIKNWTEPVPVMLSWDQEGTLTWPRTSSWSDLGPVLDPLLSSQPSRWDHLNSSEISLTVKTSRILSPAGPVTQIWSKPSGTSRIRFWGGSVVHRWQRRQHAGTLHYMC